MKYLRNLLATADIHVARYYIKRGAYVAAANRGRYVFENFQGSVAVPDALAIMVEAYQLLEINDLAEQALLVLNTNYPEHKSLDDQGNFKQSKGVRAKGRGWLNVVTFGLLG
jgi:outer membrane protein assembly factor BamD